MPKSAQPRPVWGNDAQRHSSRQSAACLLLGCEDRAFAGLPVCFPHGVYIASHVAEVLDDIGHLPKLPPPAEPTPVVEWVYYLMVSPATVKIGTTKSLSQRLMGLRTDAQYVVAIERGSRDIERKRHQQFATDRIGRRENFHLSDRLKRHIESLQPDRDDLVMEALA